MAGQPRTCWAYSPTCSIQPDHFRPKRCRLRWTLAPSYAGWVCKIERVLKWGLPIAYTSCWITCSWTRRTSAWHPNAPAEPVLTAWGITTTDGKRV